MTTYDYLVAFHVCILFPRFINTFLKIAKLNFTKIFDVKKVRVDRLPLSICVIDRHRRYCFVNIVPAVLTSDTMVIGHFFKTVMLYYFTVC